VTQRKPLVLVNGVEQELPAGDTVSGAVASGVGEVTRVLTADYTMAATSSLVVVDYLDDGGFTLEIPADAVVEVDL
jgi:hypothetical protein